MNNTFMKEKPVFPLIMSMALPMVISMLVNSLYNIVDSFFVAQISEDAMTALSLVFPIQNLVNAIAIGFGVGISSQIAFHLGAGNKHNADIAATHGTVLSAVHGLIMMVVCTLIMPSFLGLFTPDKKVIDLGVRYSGIVFAFSVVIGLDLAFEKIFQAVGRMKVTMFSLMCGCITNIILDPVLIFGLGPFPALGRRCPGNRSWTGFKSDHLPGDLFCPPNSCTHQENMSETRQQHGQKTLCCGSSGNSEYCAPLPSDLRAEQPACCLLPELCGNFGHLLQASDLPLSSCQRNRPGYAPCDRI